MFDDSIFAVGRPSEAILDMIQEGLDHINAYLMDLAARSGQPPQQIIDRFLKQHARSNPTNDWNSYSKYFTQHTEQELVHLWKTGEFAGSVDSTPCKGILNRLPYSNQITVATVRKKCYELFKKRYPDTWQGILAKFEESAQYTEMGKTFGHRQQLFNRSVKQFTQSVGFYTTPVGVLPNHQPVCSSVEGTQYQSSLCNGGRYREPRRLPRLCVHHTRRRGCKFTCIPQSLIMDLYLSGRAQFFMERCHADDDAIIGHFKAHV